MKIHIQIFALALMPLVILSVSCSNRPQVTGQVMHKGQPLQGVTVRVAGMQFQTTSDAQGSYTIDYVPGVFSLNFSDPGFLTQRVPYNVSDSRHVPAGPVELVSLPDTNGYAHYLKNQIPQCKTQNFTGGVDVLGSCVDVLSVEVTNFVQSGDHEVTGNVEAKYRGRLYAQNGSAPTIGFRNIVGMANGWDQNQQWTHNFKVKLVHTEPDSWSWVDSMATNVRDGIIPQPPDEFAKLIIGEWDGPSWIVFFKGGTWMPKGPFLDPKDFKGNHWRLEGDKLVLASPRGTDTYTVLSISDDWLVINNRGNIERYQRRH